MWRKLLRLIARRARLAKRHRLARRLLAVELLENRSLLAAVPTLTSLQVSAASIAYGQTETLTATVIVAAPNTGTPTGGTVTFLDGTTTLGTATLISGTATFQVSTLPVGTDVLTASYGGTSSFAASNSQIGLNSIITTVVGNGSSGCSGDGGQATAAGLAAPYGVAVDAAGNLFIADYNYGRVREVNHATGVITTVAGDGTQGYSGDGGQATSAELNYPQGVATDAAGDLFIADEHNDRIREVNLTTGIITTVAGDGTAGYTGDGAAATAAQLSGPDGVAVDAAGDLFIADGIGTCIREVNYSTHVITTVAGNGTNGYRGDGGQATAAELDSVEGLAVDAAGDIYIADEDNVRIREVNHATGVITTVAGDGTNGHSGDNGQATAAELLDPRGVAVGPAGDLFIADGYRIREVNLATGVITTIAGDGTNGYDGDGSQATAAELSSVMGVATDAAGNLYIADFANNRLREVAVGVQVTVLTAVPTATSLQVSATSLNYGQMETLTATVTAASPNTGTPTGGNVMFFNGTTILGTVTLNSGTATLPVSTLPVGTDVLTASYGGTSNFAASSTNIGPDSIITTYAGNGSAGFSGDSGQATAAELNYPVGVATDAAGDLFIADIYNNRIREVNRATGVVSTVAGNGTAGFAGDDGQATAAELNGPLGIALNAAGDLFIADSNNNRVREVNLATGVITTVAGNGIAGYGGDNGPATAAEMAGLWGVAADSTGDLFIADVNNFRIREVNLSTGVITTVAGDGTAGYSGDNGPATAAELRVGLHIAVDSAGDLFIADELNSRIREVNHATGVITTVAGNGTAGYSGDNGPATAAELDEPAGVRLDSAGDLFIADDDYYPYDNRIREVNLSTGVITTVAGDGTAGYSGDNGPATAAELSGALDVATDSAGDLFISDTDNNRIRQVASGTAVTVSPAPTLTTLSASATAVTLGQSVTLTATVTAASPNTGTPIGGNVTFFNGTTTLGTATLNSGTATLQVSTLPVGTDLLTASYSGSGNFAGSSTEIGPNSIITTVAGSGTTYNGDGIPATAAELGGPSDVAVDAAGDIFIADALNERVREVNHLTGAITTVAGNGTLGDSGDGGQATAAQLTSPAQVVVNAAGSLLFIGDDIGGNGVVREVNLSTGVISTVAGGGTEQPADGTQIQPTAAALDGDGLALDTAGHLFIADDKWVVKVDLSTGLLTVVAGDGTAGYSGVARQATAASLEGAQGVALDAAGDLFITDFDDNVIREVNYNTQLITTIAGNGTMGFSGDGGQATAATLDGPSGVAVDSRGDLFIADGSGRVREVNLSTGVISTAAGNGTYGFSGDGSQATAAEISTVGGVAADSAGNLYIADADNGRVREVNFSTRIITTVAGDGPVEYSGDGGPATAAELGAPTDVAVDAAGDLFVAGYLANRVREINHATGAITTVAGDGVLGYSGNGGPATLADLSGPGAIVVDAAGDLFIDCWEWVREVNQATGVITTVAGNGTLGDTGDGGPATAAELGGGGGLAVDAAGNLLFIADSNDGVVREVNLSTGIITTVAGGGSQSSGGSVPATAAKLNGVGGLAVDAANDLFIAEPDGHQVCEVNLSSHLLTTVAGNGTLGDSGDGGPATAAELLANAGLAVDANGHLFIADNDLIREVNLSAGIITTVAGNGTVGYSGDGGPATAAELSSFAGLAVDTAGNLFVADNFSNRIREVAAGTTVTVSAATIWWTGGGDGKSWGDSQNWTAANTPIHRAPLTTDDVLIGDSATVYAASPVMVDSLQVQAGATLYDEDGMVISGGLSNSGTVNLAGVDLTVGSGLTNDGALEMAGSPNEQTLTVTSGVFLNAGTLQYDGGDYDGSILAALQNSQTGTIRVNKGFLLIDVAHTSTSDRATVAPSCTFTSAGTIDVDGDCSVGGVAAPAGLGTSITGTGAFQVSADTWTLGADWTLPTTTATFVFHNSTVTGPGRLIVPASDTVGLMGATLSVDVDDRGLLGSYTGTIAGNLAVASGAVLAVGFPGSHFQYADDAPPSSSAFSLAVTGNVTNDGMINLYNACAGGTLTVNGTLNNGADGTIRTLAGFDSTGAADALAANVDNLGTIDVSGSNLSINGGTASSANALAIGAGGTIDVGAGRTLAVGGAAVVDNGRIQLDGNATADFLPTLTINGGGSLHGSPASTLELGGSLLGNTTNVAAFEQPGTVIFDGHGTADDPQKLELMEQDQGNVLAGYANSLAYDNVIIGPDTYVELVDQADNSPGGGREAGYAQSLAVSDGSTFDTNGLNFYVGYLPVNTTTAPTIAPTIAPATVAPIAISLSLPVPSSPSVSVAAIKVPLIEPLGAGGAPTPPTPRADNPGANPSSQLMGPEMPPSSTTDNSSGGNDMQEALLLALNDVTVPAANTFDVGDLPAEPKPPQKAAELDDLPPKPDFTDTNPEDDDLMDDDLDGQQHSDGPSLLPWLLAAAASLSTLAGYVWHRFYVRRRRRRLDMPLFWPPHAEKLPDDGQKQPSPTSLSMEELEHGHRQ